MGRHIALLRGINVGGKHKVPMKRLAALFEEAGCQEVATYIQSGNVVFGASAALARRVPAALERALRAEFGFDVPIVTRSAKEWAALVAADPFVKRADPAHLAVGFLPARPTRAQLAELDPERGSPDEFRVLGREIYLHLPGGMARTKLTNAYFDSRLATTVTFRNRKTVLALLELSR